MSTIITSALPLVRANADGPGQGTVGLTTPTGGWLVTLDKATDSYKVADADTVDALTRKGGDDFNAFVKNSGIYYPPTQHHHVFKHGEPALPGSGALDPQRVEPFMSLVQGQRELVYYPNEISKYGYMEQVGIETDIDPGEYPNIYPGQFALVQKWVVTQEKAGPYVGAIGLGEMAAERDNARLQARDGYNISES